MYLARHKLTEVRRHKLLDRSRPETEGENKTWVQKLSQPAALNRLPNDQSPAVISPREGVRLRPSSGKSFGANTSPRPSPRA